MEEWIQQESDRLEQERAKRMEELGFAPIVSLRKGENRVEIDTSEQPREVQTRYGPRKALKATVNSEQGELFINPNTPLYNMVIEQLRNGNNNIRVLRSGEGKETRYELL